VENLVTRPAEQALEYAREIARTLATAPGGLDLSAVIVHGSIGFGDYVAGRSEPFRAKGRHVA
jgi:hypothetical protein